MQTRRLGASGLEVSRIGLGCVTFGREIDEAASFEILDYAVSRGVTLLDTAESYSDGASERILGLWLQTTGCRQNLVIETKVTSCFTVPHVREALDQSLERLRSGHVDVYLLHQFDPSHSLEEALEAMTAVVEAGKARVAGCSNFTAAQLDRALSLSDAHGWTRLQVIQPVYNLVARQIETDLLPLCQRTGIGVVSYSPLAAGFLTGKYSPAGPIPEGTRFAIKPGHADMYCNQRNFAVVDDLRERSARTSVPMERLAMNWVLANEQIDCVLVGARSICHIENGVLSAQSN